MFRRLFEPVLWLPALIIRRATNWRWPPSWFMPNRIATRRVGLCNPIRIPLIGDGARSDLDPFKETPRSRLIRQLYQDLWSEIGFPEQLNIVQTLGDTSDEKLAFRFLGNKVSYIVGTSRPWLAGMHPKPGTCGYSISKTRDGLAEFLHFPMMLSHLIFYRGPSWEPRYRLGGIREFLRRALVIRPFGRQLDEIDLDDWEKNVQLGYLPWLKKLGIGLDKIFGFCISSEPYQVEQLYYRTWSAIPEDRLRRELERKGFPIVPPGGLSHYYAFRPAPGRKAYPISEVLNSLKTVKVPAGKRRADFSDWFQSDDWRNESDENKKIYELCGEARASWHSLEKAIDYMKHCSTRDGYLLGQELSEIGYSDPDQIMKEIEGTPIILKATSTDACFPEYKTGPHMREGIYYSKLSDWMASVWKRGGWVIFDEEHIWETAITGPGYITETGVTEEGIVKGDYPGFYRHLAHIRLMRRAANQLMFAEQISRLEGCSTPRAHIHMIQTKINESPTHRDPNQRLTWAYFPKFHELLTELTWSLASGADLILLWGFDSTSNDSFYSRRDYQGLFDLKLIFPKQDSESTEIDENYLKVFRERCRVVGNVLTELSRSVFPKIKADFRPRITWDKSYFFWECADRVYPHYYEVGEGGIADPSNFGIVTGQSAPFEHRWIKTPPDWFFDAEAVTVEWEPEDGEPPLVASGVAPLGRYLSSVLRWPFVVQWVALDNPLHHRYYFCAPCFAYSDSVDMVVRIGALREGTYKMRFGPAFWIDWPGEIYLRLKSGRMAVLELRKLT